MIILHPDHLISATVVADAVTCQRRAVLQDRIKATSDINKPQVYGHVLHEVFQEALKVNKWDLQSMRTLVERVLVQYVESLYAIHVSMVEAVEYVMSKVPELKAWAEVFLRPQPNVSAPKHAPGKTCINAIDHRQSVWLKIVTEPKPTSVLTNYSRSRNMSGPQCTA